MVTVLPPAAICPAAPKYCAVVGELKLVSVPFHSETSCVRSNTLNGIRQVLRLQISKLALLLSQLHIEQVVVDLCHQRLQRTLRSTRVGVTSGATIFRGSTNPDEAAGEGIAVSSKNREGCPVAGTCLIRCPNTPRLRTSR